MARTRHRSLDCSPGCAVEATLQLIDGKWKGVILYHLLAEAPAPEDSLRFSALRRRMPNVTQRMLTNQLRELEADGLITRKVYAQVPPKVEYSLSPLGLTLGAAFCNVWIWAVENHDAVAKARTEFDGEG